MHQTTLYDSQTRSPVGIQSLPLGRVMVTRYTKPAVSGNIIIPETARHDPTFSTWEVVCSSSGADEAIGTPLGEGDILRTQRRVPVDSGLVTQEGLTVFVMDTEGVFGVIKNTWSER